MRQAMPVQEGKIIDFLNSTGVDIPVGNVVVFANFCGVAEVDIPAGKSGAVALHGVWEVPAVTGAAFSVGDIVYWKLSSSYVTKTPTDNTIFGVVVEPKTASAAVARVKIGVLTADISVTENVIGDGNSIDYALAADAAANLVSGDVVSLTNCIGVALGAIAKGATGKIAVQGVFTLPAVNDTAFAVGEKLYWDATAGKLSKTAESNILCGIAVEAKLLAGATAKVLLGVHL